MNKKTTPKKKQTVKKSKPRKSDEKVKKIDEKDLEDVTAGLGIALPTGYGGY